MVSRARRNGEQYAKAPSRNPGPMAWPARRACSWPTGVRGIVWSPTTAGLSVPTFARDSPCRTSLIHIAICSSKCSGLGITVNGDRFHFEFVADGQEIELSEEQLRRRL